MKNEEYIYGVNDGAEYRTNIEGWVSRTGRFFGKGERGEHNARYDSSTHKLCECGNKMEIMWTACQDCRIKNRKQRELEAYQKMKEVEWCGDLDKEPLSINYSETYFFDIEEIYEYCVENDMWPHELRLVVCEPEYIPYVDEECITEAFEEGASDMIDESVWEAFENLNATIRKVNAEKQPVMWTQGNKKPTKKSLQEGLEIVYDNLKERQAKIDAGY